MNSDLKFHQIGVIHSPFSDKFGLPRQPGLVQGNLGKIELFSPWDRQEALQGLEGFSHLWIVFVFHQAIKSTEDWRPTVRPPRDGAKRQGVFATRSPYRPNPIGLSKVRYLGWEKQQEKLFLNIEDGDMLNGTPVLDIKPYLPYADICAEATGGFAQDAPQASALPIIYSELAAEQLTQAENRYPQFKILLESTLKHNPRPVHFGHIQQREQFGLRLYDYNIQWQLQPDHIFVVAFNND